MIVKKIILLVFLLLLNSCVSYKTTVNEFSNVDVNFNDGTVINGKLDFPISINQKEIYFKSKKNKVEKIKLEDVKSVNYYSPKDTIIFEKNSIVGDAISKKTDNINFLQILNKGEIKLYYGYNVGFLITQNKKEKFIQKTNLFFCKRKGEKVATLMYYDNDNDNNEQILKKIALDYFSNEQKIKEKIISTKKYNPEFLINFIKTYNNENQ